MAYPGLRRHWILAPAAWLAVGVLLARCSSGDPIVSSDAGIDATPGCLSTQALCGTTCSDLQTDPTHCGTCGHACGESMVCVAGTCQLRCPAGASACSGVCVNLLSDNANCGTCANACPAGNACSAGTCGRTCATGLVMCYGTASDAGVQDSGAADSGTGPVFCADLSSDLHNCGACGVACPPGNVCTNRACVLSCVTGQTVCAGACANTQTDNANCGACGTACASGQTCSMGHCMTSCGAGLAACSGTCVNLQTDNANCGVCGTACPAGQVCSRGACTTTCARPLATCTGSMGSYCANTAIDPANCGSCGTACALANAAASGCADGACNIIRCNTSFGDCNGLPADGCETDTRTSATNCGGCGRACVLPHATATCAAGACAVGTCATGFADCDHDPSNGCEVNTQTDNTSCGGCGTTCAAGRVCSGGACGTTCAAPLTTCVSAGVSTCASTSNDPANCGGCGMVCNLPNAAVNTCAMGRCAVASCNPGFADCDRLATTGCEANIRTDNANCGVCGRVCNLANATSACAAGACGITTCLAGFADCNHDPSDGCEVNLNTDNGNCGRCAAGCAAGQVCSRGACTATCASPLTTCGTAPGQYCANTAIDPANCGGCGSACSLTNAASSGCVTGTCTVIRCTAPYGDCDGMAANGCETNLNTSATSCGACGVACALPHATATCASGTCGLTACTAGFSDCDHLPANGCEVNTLADNSNCGACGRACAAGQLCSSGVCVASCGAPLVACAGACVNTSNDPANCGGCTTACATAANATTVCAAGTCAYVCSPGHGDCDGIATNGCETDTRTSNTSCGVCGRTCGTGTYCIAGVCTASILAYRAISPAPGATWLDACAATGHTTQLANVDDCAGTAVTLPFAFLFYDTNYTQVTPTADGYVLFGTPTTASNTCAYSLTTFPNVSAPRPAAFAYNRDLYLRAGGVCMATFGTAPTRQFVVETLDAYHFLDTTTHLTFETILNEGTNTIDMLYQSLSGPGTTGEQATVAVQNTAGTVATTFEHSTAGTLSAGTSIRFTP